MTFSEKSLCRGEDSLYRVGSTLVIMLFICLLTFAFSAIAAKLSIRFNQERELLLVIAGLGLILSLILAPGLVKLALLGLIVLNQQFEII